MAGPTHTYAVLEISAPVYAEIKERLEDAGYTHAFHDGLIDMHGIALGCLEGLDVPDPPKEP